jgi:hypothetical protein
MILATTIQERLRLLVPTPETLVYDFDVRYLSRWIQAYPSVFPKYVRENKYKIEIVLLHGDYRYEIRRL